jgi:hypothetical protein
LTTGADSFKRVLGSNSSPVLIIASELREEVSAPQKKVAQLSAVLWSPNLDSWVLPALQHRSCHTAPSFCKGGHGLPRLRERVGRKKVSRKVANDDPVLNPSRLGTQDRPQSDVRSEVPSWAIGHGAKGDSFGAQVLVGMGPLRTQPSGLDLRIIVSI